MYVLHANIVTNYSEGWLAELDFFSRPGRKLTLVPGVSVTI